MNEMRFYQTRKFPVPDQTDDIRTHTQLAYTHKWSIVTAAQWPRETGLTSATQSKCVETVSCV